MKSLIQWLKAIRWVEINLILWMLLLSAVLTGAGHNELVGITIIGLAFAAFAEHATHRRRRESGKIAEQA